MNRTARWIKTGEVYPSLSRADDDSQIAFCTGREPVGHVARETGGPRKGEWTWSMSRGAPDVDMRFETHGYEDTEVKAKRRVIEAYEELLRRTAKGAIDRQHGRLG